ncbi:MAG TPA: DUF229 domain-containing protein, partial [Phycisphaerae bacterium]|nr:DUF229 domain-containing protein [Phycisphaerae bacterium]
MSEVTRRDFVKGAVAGGVAMATGGLSLGEGQRPRRPNILLIIDDQHSPRAMGWTGQTQVRTPAIDRLASQSVNFTNGYCNSPVCAPTRHCIYTGLHTPQHGALMNDKPMRPDVRTFIAQLNQAGYTTANIGKMHNAPYTDRRDFQYVLNHEFFTSDGGITHYGPWLRAQLAKRGLKSQHKRWSKPVTEGARTWLQDPKCIAHINWMPEDLTPEYWITQQSLAFMKDQAANRPDKPFFLHASYFPPHHPYGPIKKYADMYDPADIKLPPNYDRAGMTRWWRGRKATSDLPDAEVRRWIARYFAFTTQLDVQIGRLLEGLARLGRAEDTIVIFTSDHGDMLAEHGRFYKGLMDEGSVGVPFMIRFPGVSKVRKESALVSHVDLPPTILAAAGITPGAELVGNDLRPLLAGKAWDRNRAVFSVIHHRLPFSNMMWRRGDYKLIASPGRRGTDQVNYKLFNMAKDTYEMNDLAGEAASSAVLKRMKDELMAYWAPLEKLLPAKMPPSKRGPAPNFTWPP